ncbi:D-alanyl-D-alanine carboxypeptidase family protein [Sphingomonas bacterium]|uniref:D-alanyl-D-alanine carboxypeptidase family protein n=1 Tax=Sphingomonas bacterium TaxID=1895847 RepID=UPI00157608A6|nr:D-alanyl-D-alanine carboxypeptidase family protein [Sphingomonas bacterium]
MRRFLASIRRAWMGVAALAAVALGSATPAWGRAESRVAEVVVDVATGSVLYADRADALRHPASLTKMMTLYLVFDALAQGGLRPGSLVTVSPNAAGQPASRLGIGANGSLAVRSAVEVVAVHSANDIAVALAETLAGSEERFVARMNAKARRLGMLHTHFANATGLTDAGNVTTARDIATLSVAILKRHPRDYPVFATRSVRWGRRRLANHNHLLGKVAGVDGIKTGYTVDAGYNLAASARRGGRRIVAVVLGERSIAARDVRVANLLELGFGAQEPARRR